MPLRGTNRSHRPAGRHDVPRAETEDDEAVCVLVAECRFNTGVSKPVQRLRHRTLPVLVRDHLCTDINREQPGHADPVHLNLADTTRGTWLNPRIDAAPLKDDAGARRADEWPDLARGALQAVTRDSLHENVIWRTTELHRTTLGRLGVGNRLGMPDHPRWRPVVLW